MDQPVTVSFLSRWRARAQAPVDIAPLVWFRVAFGVILLAEVCRYFVHGWIERYFIAPPFMFKYYGFGWVQPLPGSLMNLHFFALGILAACIALGVRYRLASALFFLGFTYVFLLDQARYLNHFYLVCLYSFLLAIIPAHRAFSWDAWQRPALRSGSAPAWCLWLLRAQICAVYFFGGIAKLNSDWLHGEPMRMWLARRADYPVLGAWFTHDSAAYFFSYAGLLFDLGIVPLVWWRRTRWFALGAVALFNLLNGWIFQIGIFPWLAFGATLILFVPNLPKPWATLWRPTHPSVTLPVTHSRWLALATIYVAVQILVPLRHWFYAGDVLWTEEGHRFSWRMKLRSKDSNLTLKAHDPDSQQTWDVALPNYITGIQYDEASDRPDMILQLAHHVAEDFRQQGHAHIQIHAQALVSLNGRADQLLIDPTVDLAAQPRTLGHEAWITTLTTPLSERRPPTGESVRVLDSGEK